MRQIIRHEVSVADQVYVLDYEYCQWPIAVCTVYGWMKDKRLNFDAAAAEQMVALIVGTDEPPVR